ncbi:hypothetical protein BO94DRAFT_549839 [Aspergillus sclerotioniger CBS 115572]|uniref:Uncharacterized protein n=1 Tax=Aspergillus sclerotioniger CBS 115572 TaxID=1450535 RepID=A0A317VKV1_9EURO|nr:hypothetical protein BO94DRAFT_549839 [Aspergillus sclerotioniger CBS 115572]PWY73871.1 hypothetical protein BO94DRAFT_549839 [Aspergillus sclerotioniger CBS 115572]
MVVITATLILGLFGVIWMYILWRAGYDVPLEIYELLYRNGWGRFAGPLLIISMAFTPDASEREQKVWIYKMWHVLDEEDRAKQKAFWLLAEEDTLANNVEILHDPELQAKLAHVQEGLGRFIPSLLELGLDKCQLEDERPDGAWTRYRSAKPGVSLESEKRRCTLRYGCCSRGCGCCEEVRACRFNGLFYQVKSHCTEYCGCCIRYRDSLKIEREVVPVGILPRDKYEEETRGRRRETFNPDVLNSQIPIPHFDFSADYRHTSPGFHDSPLRERPDPTMYFSDSEEEEETGMLLLEQRIVQEE